LDEKQLPLRAWRSLALPVGALLILPIAVVEDLGWLTPLGSGLVGLMVLMAVHVGEQLANPFGDSPYDVPWPPSPGRSRST